jgi:predicted GH43/DUF377 family glycosyl hydrolase
MSKLASYFLLFTCYFLLTSPALSSTTEHRPPKKYIGKSTIILQGNLATEIRNNNTYNMYAPELYYDSKKDHYLMWYGAQGPDGSDRIHLAISKNGLTKWDKKGVVLDVGKNETHVNDPSVVKVGNLFYMYYTSNDTGIGASDTIHLATSKNGVKWTKQGSVIQPGAFSWNTVYVSRPSVLHEDGEFKLWYDTRGPGCTGPGTRCIGYATSTDGKKWKLRKQYVTKGGAIHIVKYQDYYYMFIEGRKGINIKISPDGINSWRSHPNLPNLPNLKPDAGGRVTPFLLIGKDQKPFGIYYGSAQPNWNNNKLSFQGFEGSELDFDPSLPIEEEMLEEDDDPLLESNIPGDLNGDGQVDIFDYQELIANFGDPWTIFDYQKLISNFNT